MNRLKWQGFVALAALLLVGTAPAVFAQSATGSLSVNAKDTEGNDLPGVTVTVAGAGADRIQVTNAQGQARFLALDPGRVDLNAQLDGFSTVDYPNIQIRANFNTEVVVTLSAAVEEVITVTSESPLLDEKKIQAGTTVTQVELEKIPTARDPWSILNQTPGVLVDRINVGGNESGQQSVFRGPGVSDDENAFLVDGVEVTDMAAIGASPTYYDFDQFTEMQFGTGGSDVTKSTSGVSVNLITKRGTNQFRGSARFLQTDASGPLWLKQSTPDISRGDLGPGQTSLAGNKIGKIDDIGLEAGGPAKKDKVWVWGSWGQNDIKNFAANGGSDDTILENTALKINVQVSGSNSAVGQWNNGDKLKFGRNASPSRPDITTWNQRGPSALIKFEDTHVFSSNFFLTGTWSKVDGGFSLTSKAVVNQGLDAPMSFLNDDGVWQNSFLGGASSRPSTEWKLDGSYFFNTGNTNHELKFGGRMREFETTSLFQWSQNNTWAVTIGSGFSPAILFAKRGKDPLITQDYTSLWVQDTITTGNFTINAGFRYDLQEGTNQPDSATANTLFPDILPAVNYAGAGAGFEWDDISPRVGVTYALGEERKTLLRGSFATFPEQLQTGDVNRINPIGEAYATFLWFDNDNSVTYTPADDVILLGTSGFDPANPLASSDRNDPGLSAPTTQEIVLGVEHAFLPQFVVGASFTTRETSDIQENRLLVRDATGLVRTANRNDYYQSGTVSNTLPNGQAVTVPIFALDPSLENTGGALRTNGDRKINYTGFGVNFTKRLSNRWMARGYFNFGEDEWDVPGSYLFNNDPNRAETGTDIDGGTYVVASAGSGPKADVLIQSSWQWNLNGLYQVAPDRPWGFNVAANLFGREGYPLPYFDENVPGADGITRDILLANKVDDFRTDDLFTVDLRLEKEFAATGNVGFTVSMDCFNCLNEAYVLQRERDLSSGNADFLRETLSPRVWRLGVRLNWR